MKGKIPEIKIRRIKQSEIGKRPVSKERKAQMESAVRELETEIAEIEHELETGQILLYDEKEENLLVVISDEETIEATDEYLVNRREVLKSALEHVSMINNSSEVTGEDN